MAAGVGSLCGERNWLFMGALTIHALRIPILNPCPYRYFVDPLRDCSCSPRQVEHYRQKIFGLLLDRIDLHVEVPLIDFKQLT